MKKDKVKEAKYLAKIKHAHLTRKDGKTPSWKHLLQVAKRLELMGIRDDDLLSAGWLHDVIEDTDVTYDYIKDRFGKKTADIVSWLSKDNRLFRQKREMQYKVQLSDAPFDAKIVKLADIAANLADLENSTYSTEEKKQQVSQKIKYLRLIKPDLIKKKRRIPGLQNIGNELNTILEFYGMKKEF